MEARKRAERDASKCTANQTANSENSEEAQSFPIDLPYPNTKHKTQNTNTKHTAKAATTTHGGGAHTSRDFPQTTKQNPAAVLW